MEEEDEEEEEDEAEEAAAGGPRWTRPNGQGRKVRPWRVGLPEKRSTITMAETERGAHACVRRSVCLCCLWLCAYACVCACV